MWINGIDWFHFPADLRWNLNQQPGSNKNLIFNDNVSQEEILQMLNNLVDREAQKLGPVLLVFDQIEPAWLTGMKAEIPKNIRILIVPLHSTAVWPREMTGQKSIQVPLLSSKEAQEDLRSCLGISGADIAYFGVTRSVSPQEIAIICGLHEFLPLLDLEDAIQLYKEKKVGLSGRFEKQKSSDLDLILPIYALALDAIQQGKVNQLANEILKFSSYLGGPVPISLLKVIAQNNMAEFMEAVKVLETLSLAKMISVLNMNFLWPMPNILKLDQTIRTTGGYPEITEESVSDILSQFYTKGDAILDLYKGFIMQKVRQASNFRKHQS